MRKDFTLSRNLVFYQGIKNLDYISISQAITSVGSSIFQPFLFSEILGIFVHLASQAV